MQRVAGPALVEDRGERVLDIAIGPRQDEISDGDLYVHPPIHLTLTHDWQLYEMFVDHVNYFTTGFFDEDNAHAGVKCACRRRDMGLVRDLGALDLPSDSVHVCLMKHLSIRARNKLSRPVMLELSRITV